MKASPNKSCKREFKWGKLKLLLYAKSVSSLILSSHQNHTRLYIFIYVYNSDWDHAVQCRMILSTIISMSHTLSLSLSLSQQMNFTNYSFNYKSHLYFTFLGKILSTRFRELGRIRYTSQAQRLHCPFRTLQERKTLFHKGVLSTFWRLLR